MDSILASVDNDVLLLSESFYVKWGFSCALSEEDIFEGNDESLLEIESQMQRRE